MTYCALRSRPPAGDVLDGAGGFGNGSLPTQAEDHRLQCPQIGEQVTAGAGSQDGQALAPEGVEVGNRRVAPALCRAADELCFWLRYSPADSDSSHSRLGAL